MVYTGLSLLSSKIELQSTRKYILVEMCLDSGGSRVMFVLSLET